VLGVRLDQMRVGDDLEDRSRLGLLGVVEEGESPIPIAPPTSGQPTALARRASNDALTC
jgi:hypothetical protein